MLLHIWRHCFCSPVMQYQGKINQINFQIIRLVEFDPKAHSETVTIELFFRIILMVLKQTETSLDHFPWPHLALTPLKASNLGRLTLQHTPTHLTLDPSITPLPHPPPTWHLVVQGRALVPLISLPVVQVEVEGPWDTPLQQVEADQRVMWVAILQIFLLATIPRVYRVSLLKLIISII